VSEEQLQYTNGVSYSCHEIINKTSYNPITNTERSHLVAAIMLHSDNCQQVQLNTVLTKHSYTIHIVPYHCIFYSEAK